MKTTTTTALDRLRNRVRTNPVRNQSQNEVITKSVQHSAGSRQERTKSVRLLSITEENLRHTTGTTIGKAFKKGTLNGKITSHDKEREYYIIESEDGDSEELRHKTVERYVHHYSRYSNRPIEKTNKIEVTSENRSTK
jgi:hypothetical protein